MPENWEIPDFEQEGFLLKRVRKGDRDAFVKLVEPYREKVYAAAYRILGSREDAAEVTQEALLRTFWKITGFRGNSHFYTWLYRVALNLCYRRLELKKREVQESVVSSEDGEEASAIETRTLDPALSPRDQASQHERAELLRQALAHLKPEEFEILLLREFEELSYEDLSEKLHLPKGTIMSRLHRAREALARQLKRVGFSSEK